MPWRVRQPICDAGRPVNEDACGETGRFLWIADGAGSAGPPRFPRYGATDAAWLVRELGRAIDKITFDYDPHAPMDEVPGILETYLGAEWGTRSDYDPAGGPTCCLMLARLDEARHVELAVLGDVVALAPDADGKIQAFTDDRVKPFEALSFAALASGPRGKDGAVPPAARAQIQANRALMNTPQGFPIVCPPARWAHAMKHVQITLPPKQPLVLMTDGFYRLVDVFGLYTDATLYEACAKGQGKRLLAKLRAIEATDIEMTRYPRFKIHDDATLLIATPT